MTEQPNQETLINFRTKKPLKESFFRLCREENVSATARLNDFMRKTLSDAGVGQSTVENKAQKKPVNNWRDDLIRA
jgi:hypothetical protein